MFHNFTLAAALYPEDIKPLRAQCTTLELDDLVGPFTGPEVTALGVPYVAGGIVQVGSAFPLSARRRCSPGSPATAPHKKLMEAGLLHARTAGSQLIHQDLPQADNRVDLDPSCRLPRRPRPGSPTARTSTRRPPRCSSARGCRRSTSSPPAPRRGDHPVPADQRRDHLHRAPRRHRPDGHRPRHIGLRADGRVHEVDNVYVADASTFPTFPGFNPTLTIMANALRIARGIAAARGRRPMCDGPDRRTLDRRPPARGRGLGPCSAASAVAGPGGRVRGAAPAAGVLPHDRLPARLDPGRHPDDPGARRGARLEVDATEDPTRSGPNLGASTASSSSTPPASCWTTEEPRGPAALRPRRRRLGRHPLGRRHRVRLALLRRLLGAFHVPPAPAAADDRPRGPRHPATAHLEERCTPSRSSTRSRRTRGRARGCC